MELNFLEFSNIHIGDTDLSFIESIWVFYQSNNVGGGGIWDLYTGAILDFAGAGSL